MLFSRTAPALRAIAGLTKNKAHFKQLVRNHGHTWAYRKPPPPAYKFQEFVAEFVGAFTWWWILWHIWTEPEHITGEFEWSDPQKWTNEELGIPDELPLD
ncbi:NADH dehydrogenase [ubiquinone] 1 beta subcomplex subunit 2, mitochondrial-like [Euwallacea fornicatus]|uniref:NADH dehydrogenase [ubiquinone] 1 beta subcomplex subunit 2, mitochondrial-like n=1 Tax=Euwallacea fornicatus TaxID=995702 RepID=UPI00338D503C